MAVDNDWMSRYTTPSESSFARWLGSQGGQFTPMIRTLSRQLKASRRGKDPLVKAYEDILGGMRSSEQVQDRFKGLREDISKAIGGADFGAGAARASDVVEAIGGAIGADPSAMSLVSGAAGAVPGGGLFAKALETGALARIAGTEQQALSELSQRREGAMLGGAEARKARRGEQQDLARMLAEVRGQRRGSRMNPFDIAQMVGGYQDWMKSRSGGGYGGGYGSGSSEDETPSKWANLPEGVIDMPTLRWFFTPNKKGDKAKVGAGGQWSTGSGAVRGPSGAFLGQRGAVGGGLPGLDYTL